MTIARKLVIIYRHNAIHGSWHSRALAAKFYVIYLRLIVLAQYCFFTRLLSFLFDNAYTSFIYTRCALIL